MTSCSLEKHSTCERADTLLASHEDTVLNSIEERSQLSNRISNGSNAERRKVIYSNLQVKKLPRPLQKQQLKGKALKSRWQV